VLVCSHCDADHIGGALEVIRRFHVIELWVPADWLDNLVSQWASINMPATFAPTFETWPHRGYEEELWATLRETSAEASEMADALALDQDRSPAMLRPTLTLSNVDLHVMANGLMLAAISSKSANRAVLAATAGQAQLLTEAADQGVRTRYLDYDAAAMRGGDIWRRPINSRWKRFTAVNAIERPAGRALVSSDPLVAFALTVQNRRAIVIQAAGTVLFCSDSGFEFAPRVEVPWHNLRVITAPHHGSADPQNLRFYDMAAAHGLTHDVASGGAWWVRCHDDSRFNWPCKKWVEEIPTTSRFCTRCRGDFKAGLDPQLIQLSAHGGDFSPPIRLRPCRC
jgi:hypothetical protein